MFSLKVVYLANVIVAGWISINALFFPRTAITTIFSNAYAPTELVRLVGCLWLSIAILSLLGLSKPIVYSPVLLIQLIYKGTWLFFVAFPAMLSGSPYPKAMAIFFLIWVVILPFVIPWKNWLG